MKLRTLFQCGILLAGCSVFGQATDSTQLCVVTGKLRRPDLSRVIGAEVVATGVTGAPSKAIIGATKTILVDLPVAATTDTNGLFTMSLMRSSALSPATNATYRIKVYYGEKMFEIPKLTIPATGNLDITDSLAVRLIQ